MVQIGVRKTDRRGLLRERVLRRLLQPVRPGQRNQSLYRIAKDADVTYSWAYKVVKDLETLRAVRDLRVTRPAIAYRYWLENHVSPLIREYQVPKPLDSIKKAGMPYAVTTYAADQVIQRYLFPRRYDVYIRGEDAAPWHKEIVRTGFVGAGNMRLLLYDEDAIATGDMHHGLRTVSIPQLILDLVSEGGVGTEAARLMFQRTYHANPPIRWTGD